MADALTDALVARYVAAATPVFEANYRPDRCLNASWICVEVMRRLHVEARALSVNTMLMNRTWGRLMQATRWQPTKAQMDECARRGGHSVGIDFTDRPDNGFPGHIVAIVAESTLIDGASGQFSRPHKDLYVPPVMTVPAPERFLKGDTDVLQMNDQGSVMIYSARLDDDRHEGTPGFDASPHNLAAVAKIVEDMKNAAE
jgi:hypothetical protein